MLPPENHKDACKMFCRWLHRLEERDRRLEATAKQRLLTRNENVTKELITQEIKYIEIEESPLANAIIKMMQERLIWQGTSNQLEKALRPYLKDFPFFFAMTLQHVATLLPLQGITILVNEDACTISKV